jgi:hypothetical protein
MSDRTRTCKCGHPEQMHCKSHTTSAAECIFIFPPRVNRSGGRCMCDGFRSVDQDMEQQIVISIPKQDYDKTIEMLRIVYGQTLEEQELKQYLQNVVINSLYQWRVQTVILAKSFNKKQAKQLKSLI